MLKYRQQINLIFRDFIFFLGGIVMEEKNLHTANSNTDKPDDTVQTVSVESKNASPPDSIETEGIAQFSEQTDDLTNDDTVDNESQKKPPKTKNRHKLKKTLLIIGIIAGAFGVFLLGFFITVTAIIPAYRYNHAEKLLAKGDIAGAIDEFGSYRDGAKRSTELRVQLGRELFEAGRYDEAIDLTNGFHLYGSAYVYEISFESYLEKAKIALNDGDAERALSFLKEAVSDISGIYTFFTTSGTNWTEYEDLYGFASSDKFKRFFEVVYDVSKLDTVQDCINLLNILTQKSSTTEGFAAIGDPKPITYYNRGKLYLDAKNKGNAIHDLINAGNYLNAPEIVNDLLDFGEDGLFGGLKWVPVFVSNNSADTITLVSDEPIARMALHNGDTLPDIYYDFSLSKYLTGSFAGRFSSEEKQRISGEPELPKEPIIRSNGEGLWLPVSEEYWITPNVLTVTTTTTQNGVESTSKEENWNSRYVSANGKVVDSTYATNAGGTTVMINKSVDAANMERAVYVIINLRLESND
jgi:tetratricopeptide (TPR) repeat protein